MGRRRSHGKSRRREARKRTSARRARERGRKEGGVLAAVGTAMANAELSKAAMAKTTPPATWDDASPEQETPRLGRDAKTRKTRAARQSGNFSMFEYAFRNPHRVRTRRGRPAASRTAKSPGHRKSLRSTAARQFASPRANRRFSPGSTRRLKDFMAPTPYNFDKLGRERVKEFMRRPSTPNFDELDSKRMRAFMRGDDRWKEQ